MGSEESADHDVRPPASDDRPKGYSAATWWPFVTAIGTVSTVIGFGVYLVGTNVGALVDPNLGIVLSFCGLFVTVSGLSAWVHQGFINSDRRRNTERIEDKYLWGILLYFPVELALLGTVVLYFAVLYFTVWPPGDLPPIFVPIIWVISGILLISTITNYLASRTLRAGNRGRFHLYLAATPVLGVLFLIGKAWNWYRLITLEGYTLSDGIFWTAFFAMDGLHGLLVAIGIVFLLVVLARTLAGQYSPEQHISVTTATWYWWVVDAVWLIIVVEVYATAFLCRTQGPC